MTDRMIEAMDGVVEANPADSALLSSSQGFVSGITGIVTKPIKGTLLLQRGARAAAPGGRASHTPIAPCRGPEGGCGGLLQRCWQGSGGRRGQTHRRHHRHGQQHLPGHQEVGVTHRGCVCADSLCVRACACVLTLCLCVCVCVRAAETSQDVESLRPPRFIHEDGVIRPYKQREGLGSQMLQVGHSAAAPVCLSVCLSVSAGSISLPDCLSVPNLYVCLSALDPHIFLFVCLC